ALEQLALDHPVDLGVDLGEVLALHRVELSAPQVDDLLDLRVGFAGLQVFHRACVVLALDVRGAGLPPARKAHGTTAGEVVADLADRADGVVQREVAERDPGFDHFKDKRRAADLHHRRGLAHVRVPDDHVQAAVFLSVGVRLVTGVDDRPAAGGGRCDALPDVLGALAQAERRRLGRLQPLARATDQLAGDQERQQHVGDPGELASADDQVVLVATVRVARRVCVVLEQVDVAADALVGEPLLGVDQQVFENPLARAVVGDQLNQAVALRGGVLGVAADIEVQARAITQEDVRAAAPRHHTAEQVARDLVRTEPAVAVERAGDTEFGLDSHDPTLHPIEGTGYARTPPRDTVIYEGPAHPPASRSAASTPDLRSPRAKGVTLESDVGQDLPQLRHTQPNGRVRVIATSADDSLTIAVSDTGDGVAGERTAERGSGCRSPRRWSKPTAASSWPAATD